MQENRSIEEGSREEQGEGPTVREHSGRSGGHIPMFFMASWMHLCIHGNISNLQSFLVYFIDISEKAININNRVHK